LEAPQPDLTDWNRIMKRIKSPGLGTVRIAVVGKYTELVDSYKSVQQGLVHGGIHNDLQVDIDWISSEEFEGKRDPSELANYDGLLVPGGFGPRGIEGMLNVIRWARENQLPFFGICLGLQCAIIEFSRNVCGFDGAHSYEFDEQTAHPVVGLMDSQRKITSKGGTMRLGAYPCRLVEGSHAAAIYGVAEISERHRHRYEVNNDFREPLSAQGMAFTGLSPDGNLVEMIELTAHPWFVAGQFHPELKSRPTRPHPLFASFVEAAGRKAGLLADAASEAAVASGD